jgi:hypothetical protein
MATQPDEFPTHREIVILSEAPHRSIAQQRAYSAKSKDPGDACEQMLSKAFWPLNSQSGRTWPERPSIQQAFENQDHPVDR